jgi:HEAT repeat protein
MPKKSRGQGPRKAVLRAGRISLPRKTNTNHVTSHLASDEGQMALAGALDHPDPEVRARAVAVVGQFSDGRAGHLLKTMIHDPSPAVRSVAISAVGTTPSMGLLASLIVALGDPDVHVRRAAAGALSRATGRTVAPSGTDAMMDGEQVEALKRWWKDKRFSDLASDRELLTRG